MSNFEKEFLDHYLRLGLGSMPKTDIDALVMCLLDRYGIKGSQPLGQLSNQQVSEQLRAPASRIKKLRYEAALKYGTDVDSEARGRLLAAIGNANIEIESGRICMIVEDALAKNWLQGKLKENRQIFELSFNTEIIRVSANGLFKVLEQLFDSHELAYLRGQYDQCIKQESQEKASQLFRQAVSSFATGAGRAAGDSVFRIVQAHLGLT